MQSKSLKVHIKELQMRHVKWTSRAEGGGKGNVIQYRRECGKLEHKIRGFLFLQEFAHYLLPQMETQGL